MKKIYYQDADGNKIIVTVSDEIAAAYKEERQKMWREDAYHAYYTTSLDRIVERGHDFKDKTANPEEHLVGIDIEDEHKQQMDRLRLAFQRLTNLQKQTLYKLFVLNMSQLAISEQEGVTHQVVNKRVQRIFSKLRSLIQK